MNQWDLLYRKDGWTVFYTTNTTTPQLTHPTYSDGFEDGWNANDVAREAK